MSRISRPASYSLLIGFFAAAIGFSYALATSSGNGDASSAGARGATSSRLPLQFTDPFATTAPTTDRDLGDAALGSTITRYVHARGGFSPYRMVSDRTTLDDDGSPTFIGATTIGEAEIALPASANPGSSTAAVFLTGLVKGQIGNKSGTIADDTPMRFDVTVADSRGSNPDKIDNVFRVSLFGPNGAYKFAQSALNDGVQFAKYYDKLEVLSGNNPYTFSVSNIMVNGSTTTSDNIPITGLNVLGLFLNKNNGVISGRPLYPGVYSFTANCVDSKNQSALSRDKSATGQTITFTVNQPNNISSDLFSTKIAIKGDALNGGKDSIKYSGLLNLNGASLSSLDGLQVQMMIGGYASPTVTLTNGKGSVAGPPSMSVSISSEGTVGITIGDESFGTAMSIITESQLAQNKIVLDVAVTIGDPTSAAKPAYQSVELLQFGVHAKSSKFELSYKFGPGNLGGGFLITSVKGEDDKKETGDSWLVQFISVPPEGKKLTAFGSVANATVGIGTDFTNTIPVTVKGSNVESTGKPDPSQPVIVKLGYNITSGVGSVLTGLLPAISNLPNTQTSIPPALTAGAKNSKASFPFLLTFDDSQSNPLVGFEGARRINAKGNQWTDKNLAK